MKVYAFEPHPNTFERLSENLSKYQNAIAINKGLSSAAGALKLYDYADRDGSLHGSLFKDVITEIHGTESVTSHEVELTTLD